MVVLTIAFIAFPLVFSAIISLSSGALVFPPKALSLEWFQPLLSRSDFTSSLGISLLIGALASGISLAVGIPASMMLVRRQFRGKEILDVLFLSPLAIPAVVIGLSLLNFFILLGVRDPFLRLLVGHVIITLPYVVRVMSASFAGLDRSYEEAAMNLGADELTTFQKVTLPLMKSGIIAATVFAFQ